MRGQANWDPYLKMTGLEEGKFHFIAAASRGRGLGLTQEPSWHVLPAVGASQDQDQEIPQRRARVGGRVRAKWAEHDSYSITISP